MTTKYIFKKLHFYSRLTKYSNLGFSNSDAISELFWSKGGKKDYVSCKSLDLFQRTFVQRTFVQGTHVYENKRQKRKGGVMYDL